MPISPESRVAFCPLVVRPEGEAFLVGREDIASYVEVPEVAVRIIDVLNGGSTVGEAAEALSAEYGEEVPVADFVESMIESRMVARIDDTVLESQQSARYHLGGLRLELLAPLYSPAAFVIYGVLALAVIGIFALRPRYFPKPADYFAFGSYAASAVTALVLSSLSTLIHELSHLAAARSIGVQGRLSLGRRLIFLVAQTEMNNVWSRPRILRFRPYLAGMAADVVQTVLWLALLAIHDSGVAVPLVFCAVGRQRILSLVMGLMWQFRFYMQTDIYYVVTNYLGCRDLIGDTKAFLRGIGLPLIGRKSEEPGLSGRQRRIIRAYSVFYLIGVGVTIAVFVGFTIPILVRGATGAFRALAAGYAANPLAFIDGIAFLGLAFLEYGLLALVTVRQRLAARGRADSRAGTAVSLSGDPK